MIIFPADISPDYTLGLQVSLCERECERKGTRRNGKLILVRLYQGCGIKGFLPTSVIQGTPPLYEHTSFWEALSVVSQKWIPFPTAPVSIFLLTWKLPGAG